jgi:PRTRC genetic system ParB family protein
MYQTPLKPTQGELRTLPVARVAVRADFNPRKHFDDAKQRELAESVRRHGILQPIMVFPRAADSESDAGGEGYWVIAGERRFRAALDAGLADIPAIVREVGEQEAFLLATLENTQRADMSPGDEAHAARRVLQAAGGDKGEALRLLAWSESKFHSRLLLLHATPSVLDALARGDIKLGHAELLSQLPGSTQDGTLPKLVADKIGVADLKARLQSVSLELSAACFDTGACNGCPRNSNTQASLFEEHVAAGRCADRACFSAKTREALEARKAGLAEAYNAVFLDTERAPDSFGVVMAGGSFGVGAAQFDGGCKGCANFGALLDSTPGREGRVTEDCCFNPACLSEMQKAYAKAAAPAKAGAGKPVAKPAAKDGQPAAPAFAQPPGQTASKAGKPAAAQSVPPAVVEKAHGALRSIAAVVAVEEGKKTALAMGLYALLREAMFDVEAMPEALKSGNGAPPSRAQAIRALTPLSEAELLDCMAKATARLLRKDKAPAEKSGGPSEMTAVATAVLAAAKAGLAGRFVLSRGSPMRFFMS